MGNNNSSNIRKKKGKDEDEYHPKNTFFANREGQKRDMKLAGQDIPQMIGFEVEGSQIKFIAVYDGHGEKGRAAAEFAARSVDNYFQLNRKELKKWNTKEVVSKKFAEMFKSIQRKMYKEPDNYEQSGTCVISSLIIDKNCFVINLGDSRCVIGSRSGENKYAIQMSKDHKPNDPEEETRIKKSRGEVTNYRDYNYGPYRIYKEGENVPGLAVSRSLGDLTGHEVGVGETPEISLKSIDPQDEFVLVGSDGVFDVINSAEIVGFVFEKLEKIDKNRIADEVVDECRKRWNIINKYKDDLINEKNRELQNQYMNSNNPEKTNESTNVTPLNNKQNDPGSIANLKEKNITTNSSLGIPHSSHVYHYNIDDITCVIHFFK